jgi:hypothetical protein
MSAFRTCGVMCVVLAMAACQKSATEEQNDAVNAQREATETAQEAANDRQREVAEANQEAAKDISKARREARERSLEAVESEIQRTSGAQERANEEQQEASRAATGSAATGKAVDEDFTKDTTKRLNELDEKSRKLHQKTDLSAEARSRLNDVDRDIQSMKSDLAQIGNNPSQAAHTVERNMEHRLDAAEKTLDDID